jgi:hypothetical protein
MRQALQDPQARQQLTAMLQANPQLLQQAMPGQQMPMMPPHPRQQHPPAQVQAMPPRPPGNSSTRSQ